MRYWLMKSEPSEYSIDDLQRDRVEIWNGIRNYQVRNMMRDDMQKGDLALFYHSNAGAETGVVGVMTIAKEAYPDPTQFKKNSAYFDPKSDKTNPRWLVVDVKYKKKLAHPIKLSELKTNKKLADSKLVQKGNRLSVMELSQKQFTEILNMAK